MHNTYNEQYQSLDRMKRQYEAERKRANKRFFQNLQIFGMIVVGSAIVCCCVFAFFTGCEAVFVNVSRQILR